MMTIDTFAREKMSALALTGLSEHTSEVEPGFGFICVATNNRRKEEFAYKAEARGARVILTDSIDGLAGVGVPVFELEDLAVKRGKLAALFYEYPSLDLHCIGITGTNGKTSVAFHIASLLKLLGEKAGYMGTLGWGELDNLNDPGLTTGNAVSLQRRLAALKTRGCSSIALEISSHALAQRRADEVMVDTAIFTNLSRDHLDYHGTMSAYAASKSRLFEEFPLKVAILNADDPFSGTLATTPDVKVITYGAGGEWCWEIIGNTHHVKKQVKWSGPHGTVEAELGVVADYALANITAALIAVVEMGFEPGRCGQALGQIAPVPGRMEIIDSGPDKPLVIVDFAHTPDALGKVLQAASEFCNGQLVCVMGCGGDRDKGKRPEMAGIAGALADHVWLTSDNPRSEDPRAIIADMESGLLGAATTSSICVDRSEAIGQAINCASKSDVIVITGKGHEAYQEIGGVRYAFSDQIKARQALRGD